METSDNLQRIYSARFAKREAYRTRVWRVLIDSFFTRWLDPGAAILDLGCGFGEFINQVAASKKYGMDMNPSTRNRLAVDVEFIEQDCSRTWTVDPSSLDVVFTSNFFEHLPDKNCLDRCLKEALRCLKPGGRLIAMGPNIRIVNGRYWDFLDHYLPLTELSLAEGLQTAGFEVETARARFLP